MEVKGIGIDIVEVKRFASFKKKGEDRFLSNNFTEKELEYCFSFSDSSVHLAGTFAGKEAVWKALGKTDILQSLFEIRRDTSGCPTVWIKNRQQKTILLSISHTADTAVAVAIMTDRKK
ncbi:MAG: holo-ACP synthase [Candidatus Parcubacteria bacterium]|nr:holo-ACP synthase [Candidatus Parcubacteria bacterium]